VSDKQDSRAADYAKGDRVQVTGEGRTETWPRTLSGTVTGTTAEAVYVRWDWARFTEDEMEPGEVRPA
jgi:hypothetical protein